MQGYNYTAFEDGEKLDCSFFVQRNFLGASECDKLIAYFNNSPHKRNNESGGFFGGRIIWFTHIDDNPEVSNIMRVARYKVIDHIKEFHKLEHEVYGDSIQLVSWPEDLGMPAHYDNRHPNKHEPHPTPWRHYAGVIYLNDDYEGGELFISSAKPEIVIKPEKGMLVVFGGGTGYMHGVMPAYGNTRYTMPCWYTNDPTKAESDPHLSASAY